MGISVTTFPEDSLVALADPEFNLAQSLPIERKGL